MLRDKIIGIFCLVDDIVKGMVIMTLCKEK